MLSHGQYEKRPGAADVSGQMYEVALATLLYVRCVREGIPFALASNYSPAGSFDDLVLVRPKQALFIQLKHRQNRTKIPCNALLRLNPKGGFGLPTYLRSYLAARSCSFQLAAQLGSPLSAQDTTVIIFTNAHFQGIGSAMDLCNSDPLLETGGTCLRPGEGVTQYFLQLQNYKNQLRGEAFSGTITHPELVSKLENLSKSTNQEWLLNKMTEEMENVGELSEQSEFLKNVKVYQNQASLDDLGKLVKIEIKDVFSCSNKETDILYNQLFDMVKSWWSSGTCYLDQNSQIWYSVVNAVIDKINNKFHASHRNICVTFREEILEDIRNEVYRNQAILIQSTGSIPLLSVQKVCQALQGEKYVIATATDESINRYICVCESRWCNILVLEVLDMISSDLSTRISSFLNRGSNKRVIFVSTGASYFSTNYCSNRSSITNIDNNITLLDFNERTYSKFMNTPIEFQGTSLTLGHISKDILEGLTEDHILELAGTGQPVVIGSKLDPVIEYYVNRTLGRANIVQDSFLRHLGNRCVCAVIGTTVAEIKEIVGMNCSVYEFNFMPSNCNPVHASFIILDTEQAEQQYDEICNLFRDCKIFCLERESGKWKWLKSCGDIAEIKKFMEPTESFYQIEEIVSSSERAIAVVGVPGNGKSTLVSEIARLLKAKHPTSWIIRINLSQQMEIFSKFEHVDKNIADMILKMTSGSLKWNGMKLSHFFLESCLKRDASVAVLLDGFDEISPNYTSKGCELIRSLLENKSVFKVIVTSRPVTRNVIEEIMCTVSFQLHVFNECEKEIFFEKYLLNKLKSSKRSKDVQYKVKDFIRNIDSHIDTKFSAIPLHASILAEALSSDACKFYARENNKSSNRIDILELYESFFEKKITISLIEREGIDYTRPESRNVINVFRRKHENVHMYLALRALFTYNDLAALNTDVKENVDNAVAQVDTIYEKTGIVYCVHNGKPRFVHKTFAEYFAALWLSQNFQGNSAFVQKLFGRGLEVTRDMFDRFLMREQELHSAVADDDENRVGYLISQGRLVNAKDLGGRKPIHVAAMYGSVKAARQLLRVTSRLQDADDVLKWAPLKYAETTGSWEVAEMLLAAGASPKGLFHGAKTSESLQNFLRVFAEKGYTNLVRHLVAKGANPTAVLNRECHAALHVAAANGHVDLVNYLYAGTGRVFSSLRHVFSSSASLASYEALHVASSAAQLSVVRYLVTVCDDVDARDAGGCTALHYACGANTRPTEGHVLVVQCLLDAGADASARDADGWTPLHFAACINDSRIVRILLNAGVDSKVSTDEGDTALEIAQRFRKEETALALLIAVDGASTEFKGSRKKYFKGSSDYRRQRSNAVLRIVDENISTV